MTDRKQRTETKTVTHRLTDWAQNLLCWKRNYKYWGHRLCQHDRFPDSM